VVKHVAFLRAVNVGKRQVKMAQLREVVEGLGYDGVRTHIASGNVAFDATGKGPALERKLEPALEQAFGFEVPTFVRTWAELEHVLDLSPFDVPAGHTYLVGFLRAKPTAAGAKAVQALAGDADELVLDRREVHWHIAGKSMDTAIKPNQWDKTGIGPMTTRNITMLRKLVAKEQR
jgi:uncharacterized protein (DUF1697 family)